LSRRPGGPRNEENPLRLIQQKQKNNLPQILTLVVACGVAALVASIGVYSPNRAASMAAAKVREAAAKAAKAAAKP